MELEQRYQLSVQHLGFDGHQARWRPRPRVLLLPDCGSPGKMGIASQSVNLGGPGATATFSAWGYHTNGNCPTIMCRNPGSGQNNPATAYSNSRYQWITTDNWGQLNTWVNRTMTVTADSSGYVTIMVGGAAHPGTTSGAALYIDDVSVM